MQVKSCVIVIAEYFRPFDSDKTDIWSVIPNFLWQMGEFDLSIELQREIFETHRNIGSPSAFAYVDYDEGVSRYDLALKLKAGGDPEKADEQLKKAEELLIRSFESNIKMRGDVAIDTIDNQEYLADVYAAQNKLTAASNCYMSVITMLEKLFGPKYERINKVKEKMMFAPENNT